MTMSQNLHPPIRESPDGFVVSLYAIMTGLFALGAVPPIVRVIGDSVFRAPKAIGQALALPGEREEGGWAADGCSLAAVSCEHAREPRAASAH